MFFEQDNVRLKIDGLPAIKVPRTFSVGKIKGPFKFQCLEQINYFAVKLQPWVARSFFNLDIINGLVDLTMVFGQEILSLHTEIFGSTSFEEKVEKAESFFSKIKMPNPDGSL
jgi:hypothetical protein